MIFIVDSGATKADWTVLNEKGMKEFGTQTLGLNPEVLTEEICGSTCHYSRWRKSHCRYSRYWG